MSRMRSDLRTLGARLWPDISALTPAVPPRRRPSNRRWALGAAALGAAAVLLGAIGAVVTPHLRGRPMGDQQAASPARTDGAPERLYGPAAAPAPDYLTTSPSPAPAASDSGPPELVGLQFVSPARGWAAGDHVILATIDGGNHWVRQYAGPEHFVGVDFVDDFHGWAVGLSGLLATTDGGRTWTPRAEPPDGVLLSVHFVSQTTGWGVEGAPATQDAADDSLSGVRRPGLAIERTTDGGRSWQQRQAPPNPQDVCFTDPLRGWLSAGGFIYRSVDGGEQWTRSTLPDFGQVARDIQCSGPSALWAVFAGWGVATGHAPYTVVHTADGNSWTAVLYGAYMAPDGPPRVGSFRAVDGPGGYAGPFSAIAPDAAAFLGAGVPPVNVDIVTRGTTVAPGSAIPDLDWADGASFVSPTTGWVTGHTRGGEAIFVTHDGGHTWAKQLEIEG